MSNPITLPQARIPLGWAKIQDQRVPVEIDQEWMRSILKLVERTGGTTGYDLAALIVSVNDVHIELAFDAQRAEIAELKKQIEEMRLQLATSSPMVQTKEDVYDSIFG